MAEKDLQKTINIDGEDYDINAVYSDEAGKVTNHLTVIESTTGSQDTDADFEFNGSSSGQIIDYVPAGGGKFRGPVYLSNPTPNPGDNEVITSAQVTNRVADLNGAPIYLWNTALNTSNLDQSLYSLSDDNDKLNRFNTITGTESDFYILKSILTGGASSSPELAYEFYYNSMSPILNCWRTGQLSDSATGAIIIASTHTGMYGGKEYTEDVKEINSNTFSGNTKITRVVIPDSVIKIYNGAFKNCTGLISIQLPDSVKDPLNANGSAYAPNTSLFDGCTSLKNVRLSSKLTAIGDYAFRNCISLNSIVIPESTITNSSGIRAIGTGAFSGCIGLTSIVIPKNVSSINASAFDGCVNLKTVYYTGSAEDWAKITISSTSNTALTNATKVYNHIITEDNTTPAGTPIDLNTISKGPFIYICKDEESTASPASNKMFLKLPDIDEIVEISKGAARLESTFGATVPGYYTYETLAAIIAGINSRLAALGSTALELPKTLETLSATVIPEVIPDELKNEILVNENVVPTVQSLQDEINAIKGGDGDSLATLRDDLDALIEEVEFELNGENIVNGIDSRLDKIEESINTTVNTAIDTLQKSINSHAEHKIENITGKYANITVGGVSKGVAIEADSIEALLLKILDIKDGMVPTGFSFTISPSSITPKLGTTSQTVSATWNVAKGNSTYTGNFTPTIGSKTGDAAGYDGGTISEITVEFTDSVTSKTVFGSVTYEEGTGFTSGTLSSSATLTIKRECYYGPYEGTLSSTDRTCKDNWIATTASALANQYFVIQYPKVWGTLSSIIDNDTQYEALGSVFNSTPTEITKNGGTYYQYKTNKPQNSKMNFTIKS